MTTPNDPKYRVTTLSGGNDSTRRDSLLGDGPLNVEPAHFLVTSLPTETPRVAAGVHRTTQQICEHVMTPSLIIDAALIALHGAWVIKPSRIARFFHEADGTGSLTWVARADPQALAVFIYDEVRPTMTAGQLDLDMSHVVVYGAAALSGTLHDFVFSSLFRQADHSPYALQQWRTLVRGYVRAERDDINGEFQALMGYILAKCDRHLAPGALRAQAGAVSAWWLSTMPDSVALMQFVTSGMATIEIARRGADSEARRFAPLFDASWRRAFPPLDLALPTPCLGSEARQFTSRLALARSRPQEVTFATTTDICGALLGEVLATIDTPQLRNASNELRVVEICRLLAAAQGAARTDSGSSTQTAALHADPGWRTFVADAESVAVNPPDWKLVASTLAGAAHPGGLKFLAQGTGVPAEVLSRLKPARDRDNLDKSLNEKLAFDNTGAARPEWNVIEKGAAHSLVTGAFASQWPNFDLWKSLVRPLIIERNGSFVANKFLLKRTSQMWTSPEMLRLAKLPLYAAFKFIGESTAASGGFRSVFEEMERNAQSVYELPPKKADGSPTGRTALFLQLSDLGELYISEAAAARRLMISESIYTITRPSFVDPSGGAERARKVFQQDLDKEQIEARHDERMRRRDTDDSDGAGGSSKGSDPRAGKDHRDKRARADNDRTPRGGTQLALTAPSGKSRAISGDGAEGHGRTTAAMAAKVSDYSFGDMARLCGIEMCDAGIIFGKWACVGVHDGETVDITGLCYGKLAPNNDNNYHKRGHWCSLNCASHEDHVRDFSDKLKITWLDGRNEKQQADRDMIMSLARTHLFGNTSSGPVYGDSAAPPKRSPRGNDSGKGGRGRGAGGRDRGGKGNGKSFRKRG